MCQVMILLTVVPVGFIERLNIKIPWSQMTKEPIVIEAYDLFILAEPSPHPEYSAAAEEAKVTCTCCVTSHLYASPFRPMPPRPRACCSWTNSVWRCRVSRIASSHDQLHRRSSIPAPRLRLRCNHCP